MAIDTVVRDCRFYLGAGVVILGALSFSGCATPERIDHFSLWSIDSESSNEPRIPSAYPSWFLKPPLRDDTMMAVGYARRFAYIESSLASARENALANLAITRDLHVQGERGFQQTTQGTAARGNIIAETPAGTVDELFPTGYVAVDSALVGSMVLYLVATSAIAVSADQWTKQARPSWLNGVPTSDHHDYAVGVSGLQFYEHNAWLAAEMHSRQQLAVGRMSHFMRRWTTHRHSTDITVQRTDVILDGFQVVERYLDRQNQLLFVLSRCLKEFSSASDAPDR